MVVTSRETPLGHYLSVTTCSAGVAADKSVFLDERSEVKITILTLAIGQLFTTFHHLGKIAEKEGEYFYIKCKFDAGIGNLILSFGQDYFNLYGNILKCYCLLPRLLLYGVLEEIMGRVGQKSEGFRVGVTMEQKLRWEEAARERDMTISQMIREAVEMYIAVMKRQKDLDKKQNIR